jgi:hypothetical protein
VSPVDAETSQERVALSLSGQDCSSYRQTMAAELARLPGVRRVDLDSVPDHALVDVMHGVTTTELIAAMVRRMEPAMRCQVEIMKSCISANLSPPDR